MPYHISTRSAGSGGTSPAAPRSRSLLTGYACQPVPATQRRDKHAGQRRRPRRPRPPRRPRDELELLLLDELELLLLDELELLLLEELELLLLDELDELLPATTIGFSTASPAGRASMSTPPSGRGECDQPPSLVPVGICLATAAPPVSSAASAPSDTNILRCMTIAPHIGRTSSPASLKRFREQACQSDLIEHQLHFSCRPSLEFGESAITNQVAGPFHGPIRAHQIEPELDPTRRATPISRQFLSKF
jgi:hypothetical protein